MGLFVYAYIFSLCFVLSIITLIEPAQNSTLILFIRGELPWHRIQDLHRVQAALRAGPRALSITVRKVKASSQEGTGVQDS